MASSDPEIVWSARFAARHPGMAAIPSSCPPRLQDGPVELILHPYPKSPNGQRPDRIGFPVRPRVAKEHETPEDVQARELLRRMNEVLARVQELGEALEDPLHVWPRLRDAWERAENEADPRMAEIVRQAQDVLPRLKALEPRIRRVLRSYARTDLARSCPGNGSCVDALARSAARTDYSGEGWYQPTHTGDGSKGKFRYTGKQGPSFLLQAGIPGSP